MANRIKYLLIKDTYHAAKTLPLNVARAIKIVSSSDNKTFMLEVNQNNAIELKAEEVTMNIKTLQHWYQVIHSDKPGIVKIQCERNFFIKNIIEELCSRTILLDPQDKKIVIDFSSPNIAKPFHVGHLRSTIIGNFIANVGRHFGNIVTRINYLGDWGTQFGLLKIGLRELGIDPNRLKSDPINLLYESYVHANKMAQTDENIMNKARQYFSEVEQGLSDLTSWKEIRQFTVDELASTYKRLGVNFDVYQWESDYNAKATENIMDMLIRNGIVRADGLGRQVAAIQNRDVVVMKSDNSSLYLSRDIAALVNRYAEYRFDKILYVVDNSQTDHFMALFEIANSIDESFAEKCVHVKFGRVKGMSTRKGTVVFLKDILNEAKAKMYEQQLQSPNTRSSTLNDETCDVLGVTAVIINDLKQRRRRDYTFDWNQAVQTEGDSGIKLQYLHCRLCSIETKCGLTLPEKCDPSLLQEAPVLDLVAELARFEDILLMSHESMEASQLVAYLLRLSKHVNRAVKELRVINEKEDLARQRLMLFHASRQVVKKGLEILGVRPLNEM